MYIRPALTFIKGTSAWRYVRFGLEAAEEGVDVLLRNVAILLGQVGVEPDEDKKGDPCGAALLVLCQDLAGELQRGQEALQKKRESGDFRKGRQVAKKIITTTKKKHQQLYDCMAFEIEKLAGMFQMWQFKKYFVEFKNSPPVAQGCHHVVKILNCIKTFILKEKNY